MKFITTLLLSISLIGCLFEDTTDYATKCPNQEIFHEYFYRIYKCSNVCILNNDDIDVSNIAIQIQTLLQRDTFAKKYTPTSLRVVAYKDGKEHLLYSIGKEETDIVAKKGVVRVCSKIIS